MRQRAPKMRKLTVELMDCSEVPIVDGDEHGFADSGEVPQKETADSGRWRPPLLDSSLQKILGVEVELWASRRDFGRPLATATDLGRS
jgi:hypothetical protein